MGDLFTNYNSLFNEVYTPSPTTVPPQSLAMGKSIATLELGGQSGG